MKLWYKADMAMRRLSQYFALEDIWVNTKIIDIGDMKTCYTTTNPIVYNYIFVTKSIHEHRGIKFASSECKFSYKR